MRRIILFVLCCMLLVTTVSAAGTVSTLESNTTVNSNGTCEVTIQVEMTLSELPPALVFPLPRQARNITLNGSTARTSISDQIRNVELNSIIRFPGTHSFVIRYALPDAVFSDQKKGLILSVPLLSGFAYPVENMSFSITLPGAPERRPEFVSTYHQEAVDTLMRTTVDGNTIHCVFLQKLQDHESLTMNLPVTEALFPQALMKQWSLSTDDILMYIFAVLALLYWLLRMRNFPSLRTRSAQEPAGLTAGELGCALVGKGVDFTMMVLSWAQMGYLLIALEDNGRAILHKRMDMGNERKELERRYFHALFERRKTVDGTGHHFARLSAKAEKSLPNIRDYYLPRTGNPNVLRVLSAGVGICGGVSVALTLASDTGWRIVFGLLLGLLCALLSWQIQSAAAYLPLRKKLPTLFSLAASALWILVGGLCGEIGVALFVVLWQWLSGLAAAYGGRRSDTGKQTMAEILGLRRYLKTVSREEMKRILSTNPEYYYRLAPYAAALGVHNHLARQMDELKLPECTYLTTGMDGHLTAREWNRLLTEAIRLLDDRKDKMALQKWLGR